jgi:tryptophan-rich sensory protein
MRDSTSASSRPAAPLLGLAAWIGGSFAAGAVGGIASVGAAGFYAQLDRPGWAPPGWLFGPVWTTLYLLMGVAVWLVWRERGWAGARVALGLFVAQLACNALWTWLFFAWRRGGLALAEIAILAALIVATMAAFARVRALAAVLLVPYLMWVLFAAALTAAVWRRNPGLL